ncbi:MAG: hypothetical protein JNM57_02295 [Cyclobacteriaceae bacterium]|nr:hypothetical protein [Cyclobacteriaceae bacterium]
MKKLIFSIAVAVLAFFSFSTLQGQTLHGQLHGTWSITKYQVKSKTEARSGTLIFQTDGTFMSEGILFGVKDGSYRTNENNSVLILDTSDQTSEWVASVKGNILRLHSASKTKRSRVYITLTKASEQ